MSWIGGLFQQETLPVLETSLGFAHQRQLAIMNNIANVETPYYKRQGVADSQFQRALGDAIEARRKYHPSRFEMRDQFDIRFGEGNYPLARRVAEREWGPERHDENSVTIEREMSDLAKNTMLIEGMQRLLKKKLTMMRSSLRDRVG